MRVYFDEILYILVILYLVIVLAEMIRKKLFKVQHSTDAELFCYPIVCAEVERHHVTEANYRTFLLVKTLMYVF